MCARTFTEQLLYCLPSGIEIKTKIITANVTKNVNMLSRDIYILKLHNKR